jgi:hypothetical protein
MCRSVGGCRTVYKLKIGVELLLLRLSRLVLCPNVVETVVNMQALMYSCETGWVWSCDPSLWCRYRCNVALCEVMYLGWIKDQILYILLLVMLYVCYEMVSYQEVWLIWWRTWNWQYGILLRSHTFPCTFWLKTSLIILRKQPLLWTNWADP